MRDEFLNLDTSEETEFAWNLRDFLTKWGLWEYGYGFSVGMRSEMPGFVLQFPHLLRAKLDGYRKALESKNARKWLSTASPLSFSTLDAFPHFLVERHCCMDAIEATITIDHLAERKFGFCKRCGKQFEQETDHKKNYCSRRCIQAAGVKRWRDKRRELQKEAKRNAKG